MSRRRGLRWIGAVLAATAVTSLAACGSNDQAEPNPGDHLIVSIGDSVASGEGNPNPHGAFRWLRPTTPCHRSEISGQRIAAEDVIDAHPELDLSFRSFACTGASTQKGLLDRQHVEVINRPPQLDQLREFAANAEVDAVLVSIGANDVGFSDIVRFCAVKGPDCSVSRDYPAARQWAKQAGKAVPTLQDYVQMLIGNLPSQYKKVDAAIPESIDRDRIAIVEYFDPTRFPSGKQCAIFRRDVLKVPKSDLVTVGESTWAHDKVLEHLNDTIRRSANDLGWRYVDGVDEAFDGHGICAPRAERWVRTLQESLELGNGYKGTLHPTEPGHRATAKLIEPALLEALGLDADVAPPTEGAG
jgi:lysophospholipase L1-like esterase